MPVRFTLAAAAAALFGVLLLAPFQASAADPPPFKLPPVRKTDKRAAEMDYGPVIATTLGVGPNTGIGNVTPKGLVICLDKEQQTYLCFDTELLRVSAAWTGERFNMQGRAFADNSDTFSFVETTPIIATSVKPGWVWERDGYGDTRDPKDGPLPRERGRFDGIYPSGERVLIAYTVYGTTVLEQSSAVTSEGVTAILRVLFVGPSDKDLSLYVGNVPKGDGLDVKGRLEAELPNPDELLLPPPDMVTSVTVAGGPLGPHEYQWARTRDGGLYLKIPPRKTDTKLGLFIARLRRDQLSKLPAIAAAHPDLKRPAARSGRVQWPEIVTTKGKLGAGDGPYVIDDLGVPEPNPYKSWIRFTGMDFFPDGKSAALCTWNGDVWVVSGIDEKLEKLTWKRFAAGLHQPMGLKIVDGTIYANCRDQITSLHDRNGDGEADYYANFNNDVTLTTNFHEFSFDLQTDRDGNFVFGKGSAIWAGEQRRAAHNGTVLRVSKDGSKLDVLATGLRAPNGVGISPDGDVTCSDNQGNWVPTSCVNLIRPGPDGKPLFYGYHHPGERSVPDREPPLVWIPHGMDKSPGTQLWVPDERWGPLKGSMVEASYDTSLLLIPYEKFADGAGGQGAAVKLPVSFPSGTMRARFNPADGQLYVCGLRGWSSRAAQDACFQRVRYTGKPVYLPAGYKVAKDRVDLTFTAPLDPASVDAQNVGAEWYNVIRTQGYGSGEMSVNDPKKKGRDVVEVRSAKLAADGRTVSLEIPGLKPVTNLELKLRFKGADGRPVNTEISCTVNRVP